MAHRFNLLDPQAKSPRRLFHYGAVTEEERKSLGLPPNAQPVEVEEVKLPDGRVLRLEFYDH